MTITDGTTQVIVATLSLAALLLFVSLFTESLSFIFGEAFRIQVFDGFGRIMGRAWHWWRYR